jgi:hypothetical protein
MAIVVVNKYKHTPTPDDVYIGRGSALGNPFRISDTLSRDDVIRMYTAWLLPRLRRSSKNYDATAHGAMRRILKSHRSGNQINLVCFCAPQACHGDVIKRLIERKASE